MNFTRTPRNPNDKEDHSDSGSVSSAADRIYGECYYEQLGEGVGGTASSFSESSFAFDCTPRQMLTPITPIRC